MHTANETNGKLILRYFIAKKKKKACKLDLEPYTRVLTVRECAFICGKMINFSAVLFFSSSRELN